MKKNVHINPGGARGRGDSRQRTEIVCKKIIKSCPNRAKIAFWRTRTPVTCGNTHSCKKSSKGVWIFFVGQPFRGQTRPWDDSGFRSTNDGPRAEPEPRRTNQWPAGRIRAVQDELEPAGSVGPPGTNQGPEGRNRARGRCGGTAWAEGSCPPKFPIRVASRFGK